ncbi:azurin [Agriterribacter sp.]|uniref:azurin n=1 Tax=Agriterribacter sp. TaxID=2821509 RepID=UPI002C7E7E43|nr:azurin [Agriterribacter sp.]HTN08165.1 azurin [Agriterribacter sp.]
MKIIKYALIAGVVSLAACGSGDESSKATDQPAAEEQKAETPAATPAAAEGVTLEITGNDVMKFDKTELRAKAGQKVTLTLHHSGKLAKEAMGHNVVILKTGTDVAAFAAKAVAAKANDYFPESEAANVIAHTKIIGAGESVTIEFTAPEAGTYPFICSFPGHYGFMKGDFIVE